MKKKLKTMLCGERYSHSISVMNAAKELAQVHGADVRRAEIAGLLHDCMRDAGIEKLFLECKKHGIAASTIESSHPELLHSVVGAYVVEEEFGVTDPEVKDAIRRHTTGEAGMSTLSKIIFLSDYLDPEKGMGDRDEVLDMAMNDIDAAMLYVLEKKILYIIKKKALMHPETINARNDILMTLTRRG